VVVLLIHGATGEKRKAQRRLESFFVRGFGRGKMVTAMNMADAAIR